MEEFLKTVARHYHDRSIAEAEFNHEPASLPLSRYLFCFPNRRSGLFFARHLQEAFGGPCCVPAMTTISELFGNFSSRHVIDRISLLFRLYKVYQRLSHRGESFDQFVFWGDMLLSDFDDVDKYLVNPDQLFTNIKDLKEIELRFSELDPEQIRIIKSFWTSFQPEKVYEEGDKHEVFGQRWAILAPLYHQFHEELAKDNLAYEGMMEREVLEQMNGENVDELLDALHYEKVIFVGLTAISKVDRRFMELLKVNGRAEFCWDYADPRLRDDKQGATSATYFTRKNLSDFANELTDEELAQGLVSDNERQIDLYSVSSGVGQARKATGILREWKKQLGDDFDPFRTAVVLPDEKLLLPMLYAVPKEFGTFNVTMGYSLRNTPIAAFVNELSLLQQAYRKESDTFYFRQVLPILAHSYTLAICGDKVREMSDDIVRNNRYQVPVSTFADDDFLKQIFQPLSDANQTLEYLENILNRLMQKSAEKEFDDTDYEFLYHFLKNVSQLHEEVKNSSVEFTPKTLFLLLDRLISGASVPFSGEPLKGLQVMGVLETRSLDFDNVVILSMNEGTFPAKPVQNTFVPMSLREAFDMPTQRHRDSVFAYHFYRLISRAKRVAMIYDSRTEGMQSGEESRYVKQLRYLMNRPDLVAKTDAEDIGFKDPDKIVIHKTPEVMEQLNEFLASGSRVLSATALKAYIQCPLKFYLAYVRKLKRIDEVSESIDSTLFGDIYHDAMHSLYSNCEGRTVTSSFLDKYISPKSAEISLAVSRAFKEKAKVENIEGYNLLVAQNIESYVRYTLQHDRDLCPFVYLSGEKKQFAIYTTFLGTSVRISCIYDRLDRLSINGEDTIRIVDYKTASSDSGKKLNFGIVEDFFTPDGKGSPEAFQVMLYCLLLSKASPRDRAFLNIKSAINHVSPHLYFVRDLKPGAEQKTAIACGSGKSAIPVNDFGVYAVQFDEALSNLISDIFDPQLVFDQCKDTKSCEYCPFTNICKRIIKNDNQSH